MFFTFTLILSQTTVTSNQKFLYLGVRDIESGLYSAGKWTAKDLQYANALAESNFFFLFANSTKTTF